MKRLSIGLVSMVFGILCSLPVHAITQSQAAAINQVIADIKQGRKKGNDAVAAIKKVTKGLDVHIPLVENLYTVAEQKGIDLNQSRVPVVVSTTKQQASTKYKKQDQKKSGVDFTDDTLQVPIEDDDMPNLVDDDSWLRQEIDSHWPKQYKDDQNQNQNQYEDEDDHNTFFKDPNSPQSSAAKTSTHEPYGNDFFKLTMTTTTGMTACTQEDQLLLKDLSEDVDRLLIDGQRKQNYEDQVRSQSTAQSQPWGMDGHWWHQWVSQVEDLMKQKICNQTYYEYMMNNEDSSSDVSKDHLKQLKDLHTKISKNIIRSPTH